MSNQKITKIRLLSEIEIPYEPTKMSPPQSNSNLRNLEMEVRTLTLAAYLSRFSPLIRAKLLARHPEWRDLGVTED